MRSRGAAAPGRVLVPPLESEQSQLLGRLDLDSSWAPSPWAPQGTAHGTQDGGCHLAGARQRKQQPLRLARVPVASHRAWALSRSYLLTPHDGGVK